MIRAILRAIIGAELFESSMFHAHLAAAELEAIAAEMESTMTMYDALVCPQCGCQQFTQRRYVAADVTVEVSHAGMEVLATEITDYSERDADEFRCDDCSATYYDADDLITHEAYMTAED